MRHLLFIRLSPLFFFIFLSGANLIGQTQTVREAEAGQPLHQRQGFFDYALGKINSTNSDYGATMANGRDKLVRHTVDDLYFWSNIVTLILLSCATGIIYFEWCAAAKKEIVAATIIAGLWNGRVSDRIEIVRRTEQFNRLVEMHNLETERLLTIESKPSNKVRDTAGSISKSVSQLGQPGSPAANSASKCASTESSTAESVTTDTPDGGTFRMQQNNLLLQRRVEALENSERNLKQRLNQTMLLLDGERRRKATLKGV
jgi:hypothetical protein